MAGDRGSCSSVVSTNGPTNCIGQLKWDPTITNPMFADLVDLLRCHHCKKLSYNVHNLSKCDHVLCADCKNGIVMRKCPVCKTTTTEIRKDSAYESLIKDVRMLNQQYLKISFIDKSKQQKEALSRQRTESEDKESPVKEGTSSQVKEMPIQPPKVTDPPPPQTLEVKEPQVKEPEPQFKAPKAKEVKSKESRPKEPLPQEPEARESCLKDSRAKGSKLKESPIKESRLKRVRLIDSPEKKVECRESQSREPKSKGSKASDDSPAKETRSKAMRFRESPVREPKSKGSKAIESPVKEVRSKGTKNKESPVKEPRSKRPKIIDSPVKESKGSKANDSPVKEPKQKTSRVKDKEHPIKDLEEKREKKSKSSKVRELPAIEPLVKEPRPKRTKALESPIKEVEPRTSKSKESPKTKSKASKPIESPLKEPKGRESKFKDSQATQDSEISFDDDSIKSKSKGKKLIAATLLTDEQKKTLDKFSKTLGIKVTSEFPKTVTHLITKSDGNGRAIRSMKYMRAILTNKWILSFDWITQSLKEGEVVPEEQFEILGTTRQAKNQLGAPNKSRTSKEKLFAGFLFCFDGKFKEPSLPSLDELRELVTSGGAQVINQRRLNTSIKKNEKVVVVKDQLTDDDKKTTGNGKIVTTTDLLNALTAFDTSLLIN